MKNKKKNKTKARDQKKTTHKKLPPSVKGKRKKQAGRKKRGKQEQKRSRGEIVQMILGVIGAVAALGVVMVCPNIVQLVPREYRSRYPRRLIKQAVLRLDKRGWIQARETVAGWNIQLTKEGYGEWRAYEFGKKQITRPSTWDGKWHVLLFDIPEKKKFLREKVRRILRSFGFYRLQDSVWIFPYDCREILELLRIRYNIRSEALYACLERLDNDYWLRHEFKLNERRPHEKR